MSKSVTERLTDTSKYTGSHQHRFDASGAGRGAAGRENIVDYDGSTNAGRRKSVENSVTKGPRKKVIKGPKMGQKKFGLQTDCARIIEIFKNGDKNQNSGTCITLNSCIKTFDQLLKKAPNLDTGVARKLYKADLKTICLNLDDFENGGQYLACVPAGLNIVEDFTKSDSFVPQLPNMERAKAYGPNLSEEDIINTLERFTLYDTDGNYSIDASEFTAGVLSSGISGATEIKAKKLLEKYDFDQSGTIDFYEFVSMTNDLIDEVPNGKKQCTIQ
eukprot:UC4_evm4s1127